VVGAGQLAGVTERELLIVAAIALVAASAAAAGRWTRWRARVQNRRRVRRGFAGQARAARLLQRAGFTVLDAQPRVAWATAQDGEHHVVELRADYLVERDGARYVAEVKTGDAADALGNAATRRQLLEYQLGFAVAGVLLVCPERDAVHRIEFPALDAVRRGAARRSTRWLPLLLAGAGLGWAGARWLERRGEATTDQGRAAETGGRRSEVPDVAAPPGVTAAGHRGR
jgi:hypothetical protein